MEKFKVALTSQGGEAVVEAHTINLNFQPAFNGQDSLSDGNLSISGKQTAQLTNGQALELELKPVNVRLGELQTQIATMPAGDEKVKAQAKFDIWSLFLNEVQNALGIALVAQYELDNPIIL